MTHFEKMLEDNARLLTVFLHAYQVTGRELFRDTARSMIAYLNATLHDHDGDYFYGSQDADEHYYTLSQEARAKLTPPYVDHNLYTDWNALMVAAYFEAARVLEDPSLQNQAISALATLGETMFALEQGMFHFRRAGEKIPQLPGQLADQAYVALAYMHAYEATARPTYLTRARILAEFALEHLWDKEQGGFFSEAPRADALGLLRVPDKSLADNAALADALTRLFHFTAEEKYRDAAEQTLAAFANDYEKYSFTAAPYALAVERFLNYPLHITIVGSAQDDDARALLHTSLKQYAPAKIVELLDPSRDAARLNALGYPAPTNGAQAFVCVGQVCLPPVSAPQKIIEAIARVMNK